MKKLSKKHSTNVLIWNPESHHRPLRQINGNIKSKNNNAHPSSVIGQENISHFIRNGGFCLLDKPLTHTGDGKSQSVHMRNRKNEQILNSILTIPLERLNVNPFSSIFNGLKKVLSSQKLHFNDHSDIKKTSDPFHRWGKNKVVKQHCLEEQRKRSANERTEGSKSPQVTCKVTLERIDAKIHFMDYLKLKPKVKVDVEKMRELQLLRRHNIKRCYVKLRRVRAAS